MTDTMARATPLDGALWLIGHGFAVFPADHPGLVHCAGIGRGHDPVTCVDRGKHPAVTFTTRHYRDAALARRDFGLDNHPRNVGVYVGGCTGPEGEQLLVVDSDRPNAIEDTAAALGQTHTPTMRVTTAKGYHDYYWAPVGVKLGNRLGTLQGHFDGDVRAGNAFVIGPGSVHATGVTYELEDPEQPPVALPEWLLTALQAKPTAPAPAAGPVVAIPADRHDTYTRRAVQAECDAITAAPEGDQNNIINTAAFSVGTLIGAGALTEGEARQVLLAAARAGNHPEGRALATINSGLTAGIAHPRTPWPPVARTNSWPTSANDFTGLITPDTTAEPPAAVQQEQVKDPSSGRLPEEFYAARPIFQHIRQAAHSQGCSADVLLYSTLARMSGMLSHHIRAVTGIAGRGSLNLFVAAVGKSGAGKSTGASMTRDLMPVIDDEFRDGLPIGSGEGIAETYMGSMEEPTGEIHLRGPGRGDPVMKRIRTQVRHNAYFYVDEGETLATLAMRTGSILSETLRRAAVGETLGQTNASEERTRFIAAGSYSCGLLVGFQPSTALPLLADSSTGTPQRFVWTWANDPTIPDVPTQWPGPIEQHPGQLRPTGPVDVTFPERIRQMLWLERVGRARGDIEVAELDGHAGFMKVKLASLFALLDGNRLAVTEEDWALAEMAWAASCAVRDGLVARALREAEAERQAQDDAKVFQELRVHEAKSGSDLQLDRIGRLVRKHASTVGGITYGALKKALASRDRPLMERAISYAVKADWVVDEDDRICVRTGGGQVDTHQ